jgi:hypothetical protein
VVGAVDTNPTGTARRWTSTNYIVRAWAAVGRPASLGSYSALLKRRSGSRPGSRPAGAKPDPSLPDCAAPFRVHHKTPTASGETADPSGQIVVYQ